MTILAWIIILILAGISVAALLYTLFFKHKFNVFVENFNARLETQENELSAILDGTLGMGRQLQELRKDLKYLKEKQQHLEQRDLGSLPYNQAVLMVGNGANADQLVENCGLSRAEADLVILLHKSSPPTVEPFELPTEIKSNHTESEQESQSGSSIERAAQQVDEPE